MLANTACSCLEPGAITILPAEHADASSFEYQVISTPACGEGSAVLITYALTIGLFSSSDEYGRDMMCNFVRASDYFVDACPGGRPPWWDYNTCRTAPLIGPSRSSRVPLRRASREQIAFLLHFVDRAMGLNWTTDAMFPARVFYDAGIDGGSFLGLGKLDLKEMGFSIGSAHRFTRAVESYELIRPLVTPSEDIAFGRAQDSSGRMQFTQQFVGDDYTGQPTTVYLRIDVEQLIEMDEESFEFDLEFGLHASWEDDKISSFCERVGADGRAVSDDDICSDVWQPRFKYVNAVGEPSVIDDSGVTTLPGAQRPWPGWDGPRPNASIGITFQRLRGRFLGSFGFEIFPSDSQNLTVVLRTPTLQTMDKVRLLASAAISENIVQPASWRVASVSIKHSEAQMKWLSSMSSMCSWNVPDTCRSSWCTSAGEDCWAGAYGELCTCSIGEARLTGVTEVDQLGAIYYQYTCCTGGDNIGEMCYGAPAAAAAALSAAADATPSEDLAAAAMAEATTSSVCEWHGTIYPTPVDCGESCEYSNDGNCDDGGLGAEFDGCSLGTDCNDCGSRVGHEHPPNADESYSQNSEYNQNSEITLVIRVERIRNFYLLNYVVMVVALTSLSFFTFFLPSDAIDTRMSISLTVVLSINVFQIMLVERLPDTGYNTNMHWFTILCTLLVVLVCMQNLFIYRANRRYAAKQLLAQRLMLIRKDVKKSNAIKAAQQRFLRRITAHRASAAAASSTLSSATASLGTAVGIRPMVQSSGVKVTPEAWGSEASAPPAEAPFADREVSRTKQPTSMHLRPTKLRHHVRSYANKIDRYADKVASKAAEVADAHSMWVFPLALVIVLSCFDNLNWLLEPK